MPSLLQPGDRVRKRASACGDPVPAGAVGTIMHVRNLKSEYRRCLVRWDHAGRQWLLANWLVKISSLI